MTPANIAVFGIFQTPNEAERGVDHLLAAGFNQGDVSVLLPDREDSRDFAYQKSTLAPEGAATGATAGGLVGGAFGLLAGLGALAIPGIGPLLAAGPILGALAGLGVGGAVGGMVGTLVGYGMPEYTAKRLEGKVRDGGTLVVVHCETEAEIETAKVSLKSTGALDVSSADEDTTVVEQASA